MEVAVKQSSGQDTGKKVNLNKAIFDVEPNDHAIYLDVKLLQANARQGNSKTKERGEIAGSTRKIKKQKGTGGARAGSIKSPLFVGGGRIFGPVPRYYGFKINKKVKDLARVGALSYKAREEKITVLEDFSIDKPDTGEYNKVLDNLELKGKKTLMVLPEGNKNLYLSSRNLPGAKVVMASDLNTYDILNAHNLIVFESALPLIEKSIEK
jgi:large subunit ribosomal protein L4